MNVHIYPSALKNESRIFKIVQSLRTHDVFNEVLVVGRDSAGMASHQNLGNGISLIRLKPLFGTTLDGPFGKAVRTIGWYLAVMRFFRAQCITCLNCHSLPLLPLSVLMKFWKRCSLVYDTHELETETSATIGLRKKVAKLIEGTLISYADAVCVVNDSIAAWYKRTYSLKTIWVVHNMPPRLTEAPRKTGLLRQAINLQPKDALLYIYQGKLAEGRGIDILLEVFGGIGGNRHLVFMGYGPLENRILEAVRCRSNIHFMPAVEPNLVTAYTVDADVGLSVIENTCLSYYLCAPNKLYEYAACGVVPVVSDFPEMADFVDKNDCGWKVEPTTASLRSLIDSIDYESLEKKRRNAASAGQRYCWENEEDELLQMYQTLGYPNESSSAGYKK